MFTIVSTVLSIFIIFFSTASYGIHPSLTRHDSSPFNLEQQRIIQPKNNYSKLVYRNPGSTSSVEENRSNNNIWSPEIELDVEKQEARGIKDLKEASWLSSFTSLGQVVLKNALGIEPQSNSLRQSLVDTNEILRKSKRGGLPIEKESFYGKGLPYSERLNVKKVPRTLQSTEAGIMPIWAIVLIIVVILGVLGAMYWYKRKK